MAGVDYPSDGASEDTWGAELIAFAEKVFIMSGTARGGSLAIVTNEGQVVTNQGQVVVNVPGV